VLGVVHAFGELRPALVRRGDELREMALSATFEPALLTRVKNFSFRGCRFARRLSVHGGR
jgi:hypothetical protein